MPTYISTKNVFVSEKDGYVDVVVSLNAAAKEQVSVYYGTESLSASSSNDYVSNYGTLVFAPGVTTQTVRIQIKDDLNVEALENFAVSLSSPTNAKVATPYSIVTIVDNDTTADSSHLASISVRDVVVDATADSATFNVVLDKALGSSVSVAYSTANGSATSGSSKAATDYVAASGTLTFGAGETMKTVTVALPHDSEIEPAEMFSLVLGAVSGSAASLASVADGIGHATIGAHGQTEKAMPALSVNSPFVGEKDGYVDFVVSLDAPSASEVSVYFGTESLSASSSNDFVSTYGTLIFAPGVTTQTVRVTINEDLATEGLELFGLSLSSPTNAVIATPYGKAAIVDNDTVADSGHMAGLSVRDVVVDASADTATFNVVLDKAVGSSVSVAYSTTNGSALAGSDYVAASGTLTFGAGETLKTVTVALPHDGVAEPVELFNLVLGAVSGSGAALVNVVDGTGQAAIGAHGQTLKALPALSVSNPYVGEKDGYVDFVVSLDAPSASQVSVYFGTESLTTSSSNDFISTYGSLVFAPGVTTQTVRVTINDDLTTEALESLSLNLSSATNAVIANPYGKAVIVDNDTMADSSHPAALSVRDVVVDATSDTVTFNVVSDKAVGSSFSVAYSTANGSAVAGSDYLAASGSLTFGAGETVKSVTVNLPHDGVAESSEMFNLLLGAVTGSGASQVVVARGAGHATIGAHGQSFSAMPSISVGDVKVGEKDGNAEFVVSLSAPSASPVSVYFGTNSGTASSSNDYVSTYGSLVFAPGVTTQVVRVAINADNLAESLESFALTLSSAENATIARSSATASIVDASSYQVVSGSAALDTIAYSGARTGYTIASATGGYTITSTGGATDMLAGVERLQFADANVALDVNGVAGQAYRIYQAAFNRAPDAGGLGYWISVMDKGASLTDVAGGFMQSQEFIQAYGAKPSTQDLVSKFYLNVLHRPAEPAGLAYWTNVLDQKLATPAAVLAMISDSAENQAALAPVIGNGFAYTPYLG